MVSMYSAVSSAAGGGGFASEVRPGGSVGLRPVVIIEAENPWGSWGIALRVNMIPGTLSTQALAEGTSSRRAGEHVIQGPVAPLVHGVALRMIG